MLTNADSSKQFVQIRFLAHPYVITDTNIVCDNVTDVDATSTMNAVTPERDANPRPGQRDGRRRETR